MIKLSLCSVFSPSRSWRGACELLPPRHQGLGHRLLLHAGGHHHARHHPGVCVGRKCLTVSLTIGPGAGELCCLPSSVWQKINRKKHFSKTKHSKFNESGQLSAFYLFSFVWGASILLSVRTQPAAPLFNLHVSPARFQFVRHFDLMQTFVFTP